MPSAVAHVALSTALPLRSMAESAVKVRHCRWLASTRDGCDMANRAAILIPIHIKTGKHRTAEWMNFQSPAVDVMTLQHAVQADCLTANMTGA